MNRVAVEHEAAEQIAANRFNNHHRGGQQNADQKGAPLRRSVKLTRMMYMMMPDPMRMAMMMPMPMTMMMSMRMRAMAFRSERTMLMKRTVESFAVLHIRPRQSPAMILLHIQLRERRRIESKAYSGRHVKRHEREGALTRYTSSTTGKMTGFRSVFFEK